MVKFIYLLDYKEIKNNPDGKPHAYVLMKQPYINDLYMAFPLSTQSLLRKKYKNANMIINFSKEEKYYLMLNHVRTISRMRVVGEVKDKMKN